MTRLFARVFAVAAVVAVLASPASATKYAGEFMKIPVGARAVGMGIGEGELEEAYRQRSLLKRSVYPEDIAEAVLFFASELSAKSTGNSLNVDAGNQIAFGR